MAGGLIIQEQKETRVIRTARFAYWKRLQTMGEHVLFDLDKDPGQNTNVYNDPAYAKTVTELDEKREKFFSQYSDREYDLWNGGVAKGSVDRPEVYRRLYGEDWRAKSEIKLVRIEKAWSACFRTQAGITQASGSDLSLSSVSEAELIQ